MSFIMAGTMVFGALWFLSYKIGPNFIQRALGYDIVVDVMITIALMWIFAIGGTISGMLTGIFVGLLVSVALFIGKKFLTHQKLVKVGGSYKWVTVPGVFG